MAGFKVRFEPYTIKFKENRKDKFFRLDELPGKSIQDLFNEFWSGYCAEGINQEEDNDKVITPQTNCVISTDHIAAGVELGIFGMRRKVLNVTTGELRSPLERNHATCMILYFLIYFEKGADTGICMFMKYGNTGIKSEVANRFKDFVRKYSFQDVNLLCQISPCWSREYAIKFFKNAQPKKIIFRTYIQSGDTYKRLGIGTTDNKPLEVELRIQSPGLFFIRDIEKYLKKPSVKLVDLPKVEGMKDGVEVFTEMSMNGKTKMVKIDTFDNFQPEFDVHEEIRKDDGNVVAMVDFVSLALTYAKDLLADLKVKP